MAVTTEVEEIFQDAFSMQRQAVARFNAGDVRDAAEKAWCAARRATDGMILATTDRLPRTSGQTTGTLKRLRGYNAAFTPMHKSYSAYQSSLHGFCFYDGNCGPPEVIQSEIQEVLEYINDASELAHAFSSGITLRGWND